MGLKPSKCLSRKYKGTIGTEGSRKSHFHQHRDEQELSEKNRIVASIFFSKTMRV